MIQTKVKMTLAHFHDFYYLQALQAEVMSEISRNPERQFSHSVTKLMADIHETMEVITENMALRTFLYIYAACLGESRHARSTNARRVFIRETVKKNRSDLFSEVTQYPPTPENMQALIAIFSQDWHSGFGGSAWLQIAQALPMYFTMPKAAWLDYVVDLEHNNGTVFNKDDAHTTVYFLTDYPGRFSSFLDYKFSKNIVRQSPYTDFMGLSRPVYSLLSRFCAIFRVAFPSWIQASLKTLDSYEVAWGDGKLCQEEKWHEWIETGSHNYPKAPQLADMVGMEGTYTYQYTAKELTKMAKKYKEEMRKLAGKFLTKKLAGEINRRVARWLEWALQHCRQEKAKVTYASLPAQLTITPKEVNALIPLPYQGVGTDTPDGVLVSLDIASSAYTPSWLFSTFGGCVDTHFTLEFGQIVVQLPGYQITFVDKKLEALLD